MARFDKHKRLPPQAWNTFSLKPDKDVGGKRLCLSTICQTVKAQFGVMGGIRKSFKGFPIPALTSCINDTELRQLQHQRSNKVNNKKYLLRTGDFNDLY